MLRVLFLVNPRAGNGQALDTWRKAGLLLESLPWTWSHRMSRGPGDLTRLALEAARESWDRLVVVGGDGSVHEVVNGLLQSGLPADQLPALSLLPAGSGNDWARTWKIPGGVHRWFLEVADWTVHRHDGGRITCIRNGVDHSRYFMNVAGLAYDAWLVKKIEEHPASKGHALIYLWSILRWLLTYRPQQARVQAVNRVWSGRFYTINAGICRYNGGGMRVVPHADPVAGQLALTVAGNLPLWRILLNIWRFYNGSIGRVRDVETTFTREILVENRDDQPLYIEADGEWLGECPCRVTILPRAFRVWAPSR